MSRCCPVEGCARAAASADDVCCRTHALDGTAPQLAPLVLPDGRLAVEVAFNHAGPRTQCFAQLVTGRRCANVTALWPFCPTCCAVWLGVVPDVDGDSGALVLKAARQLPGGTAFETRHPSPWGNGTRQMADGRTVRVAECGGVTQMWIGDLAVGISAPNAVRILTSHSFPRNESVMLLKAVACGEQIVVGRPTGPIHRVAGPLWARPVNELLSGRTRNERIAGVHLHQMPPWVRRLGKVAAGLHPGPAAMVRSASRLRDLVWRLDLGTPDIDIWFVAALIHSEAATVGSDADRSAVDFSAHRVRSELARHLNGPSWTALSSLVATAYVEAVVGDVPSWSRMTVARQSDSRTYHCNKRDYHLDVLLLGKHTRLSEDPIGDDAARSAVFQTRPSVVPDFRSVLDALRSHVRRMLEAVDQLEELPPDDALAEALVVAIEAITVRPSAAPL